MCHCNLAVAPKTLYIPCLHNNNREIAMTTFDDRQKGFESKFALDEELNFKSIARRNKLLGLWAADKMGKSAAEAEHYARDVVMVDFESDGNNDVVEKLLKDFAAANITMTAADINKEMERLTPIARNQIMGEKK
jgi:hypothetical protein